MRAFGNFGSFAAGFFGILLVAGLGAPAQAQQAAAPRSPPAATNGPFSSNVNTAGPIAPDKTHPLDLNAASSAELSALPGIGAAQSKAIVAGRPYRATDDLVKRNILAPADYARIKDLIKIGNG
jgi:DNA uptake protein ComE-like DNA-binding protein